MAIFIIILILATIAVASITANKKSAKNKPLKYGSYVVYFILILLIIIAVSDDINLSINVLQFFLLFAVLSVLIYFLFTLTANSKVLKYIIGFTILISTLFAAFRLYDSIMNPIRFKKEQTIRYQATVEALKIIRTAQIAYKNEYDTYTPSLNELKKFIQNDSMTVIRREGEVPDSIYLKVGNNMEEAEKIALKLGMIKRDTIKISIMDTLFAGYDIERFGKVPFTNNLSFEMDTASINIGGLTVHVFEAKISNFQLLNGLDKQLILNMNDDALKMNNYPGLKVGSLYENNNNEGNWDKTYDLIKH